MSEKSHLLIPAPAVEVLKREAVEAYPEECCGVLVGRWRTREPIEAEVHEVVVAQNSAADRRRERYVIEPSFLLEVQKNVRQRGLEVVGFYHSHPDHEAIPGQSDIETAWAEVSYLILAVEEEGVAALRCWRLKEGTETFEEVDIGYS